MKVFAYCSESLRGRFRSVQDASKMLKNGLPGVPLGAFERPLELQVAPQKSLRGTQSVQKNFQVIPKRLPRSLQGTSRRTRRAPMDTQGVPQGPQRVPKGPPGIPKECPRGPQGVSKGSQGVPKRSPRGPQEAPKEAPRGPQRRPKRPQDVPRSQFHEVILGVFRNCLQKRPEIQFKIVFVHP